MKNVQKWSTNFHPIHGYCHTFKFMKKFQSIYGIDTTLLFHIIRKNMIVFLHEENDLPDNTNTNFEFSIYEIGDGREDIKASLEKKMISLPSLTKNPCMEDHYLTCKDLNIHLQLATIYGCKAPILFSGQHLKKIDQKNLPSCTSSAILQVIHILYILCFF